MYVLDTDILSLLQQGHQKVQENLAACEDANVVTTVISQVEILRARFDYLMKAKDGQQLQNAQHWLRLSMQLFDTMTIVSISTDAAAEFDRLLQAKGLRKIGRGDLLIACIAIAHKAIVVTRNVKDFSLVPGLQIVNWAK